jgi:hypothetical protein
MRDLNVSACVGYCEEVVAVVPVALRGALSLAGVVEAWL